MSDRTGSAPAQAPDSKFPILDTVLWAFMGVIGRPGLALRVLALPITLQLLAVAVGWSTGLPLLKGIIVIPAALAMVPAVVFWHRYAAFGDSATQPPVLPRIQKRDWRYLLDLIVIFAMLVPIAIALVAILFAIPPLRSFYFDLQGMAPRIAALLALVLDIGGVALATYVMSRVVLILPATALDQRIELGEAFRRSRPLALRLTIALWLIYLPAALVDLLAALSTGLSAAEMELVVRGGADGPIAIVVFFNFLAIVISYLLALASAAISTRAFLAALGFQPAGIDAASSPR